MPVISTSLKLRRAFLTYRLTFQYCVFTALCGFLTTSLKAQPMDGSLEQKTSGEPEAGFISVSKEELGLAKPKDLHTTFDTVGEQISAIAKDMGKSDKTSKKLDAYKSKQDMDDYFARKATDAAPASSPTDVEAIRSQLRKDASQTTIRHAADQSEIWKHIKTGANFDLDLEKFFGSSSTSSSTSVATRTPSSVRYSLVAQEIRPKRKGRTLRAAVGQVTDAELASVDQADVKWTIAPITDDGHKKVFTETIVDENAEIAPDAAKSKLKVGDDFWREGGRPSAKFRANVKPSDENVDQTSVAAQPTSATLLGYKLTLEQTQGFYKYESTSAIGSKDKPVIEQEAKLPIIGTIAVARKYDEKFSVISTSAYDLLYRKDMPKLSLHYNHRREQYAAQITKGTGTNSTISLGAHTEARQNVPEKDKEKPENVKMYELGLNKSF